MGLCNCWFLILHVHRTGLECRRCAHLGVSVVECNSPLFDFPDRLFTFLCDVLLGIRYENLEEQAHCYRIRLGDHHRQFDRVHPGPALDLIQYP